MADIFDLFKKIEKKETTACSPVEWVVVGLGNLGNEYDKTRHNVGFEVLDCFSKKHGFKIDRIKYKSYCGEYTVNEHRILFMKPTTFMNLSGEAVKQAMDFYKIPPEKLIVVVDDVNLAPGRIRIRTKGSAGGHNGLKNIIFKLCSEDFIRLRVGVGEKPHPDYDMANWVLSRFSKEEQPLMDEAFLKCCEAIPYLVSGETTQAMNKFH